MQKKRKEDENLWEKMRKLHKRPTKKQKRKSWNQKACVATKERDAVLKPIRYPSGRVAYLSERSLPCQPSSEPCMSGRVTWLSNRLSRTRPDSREVRLDTSQ